MITVFFHEPDADDALESRYRQVLTRWQVSGRKISKRGRRTPLVVPLSHATVHLRVGEE